MNVTQGTVGRVLVTNQRLQCLGVVAKNRQRENGYGARLLRIPLAAMDIDEAARAFHIDQVHAVWAQKRDVDLEDVVPLPEFEVVDDGEAVQADARAGRRSPGARSR